MKQRKSRETRKARKLHKESNEHEKGMGYADVGQVVAKDYDIIADNAGHGAWRLWKGKRGKVGF